MAFRCSISLVIALAVSLLISPVEFALTQGQADTSGYQAFRENFGVYEPSGSLIRTNAEISGVREYLEHDLQGLFQTARVGMTGYTFRVPNGSYRVSLYFAEIEHSSIGARVFDISLQGQPIVEGFDIFSEAGANRAHAVVSQQVDVTDELLRLEFQPMAGEPLLAGISIDGDIAGAPDAMSRTFFSHMNAGGSQYYGFNPDFGQ